MKLLPRIAVGLLILTMACPLLWAADPAIVFVDEAKAGAKAIMVMDADGSNRREVFRTRKRFCDCGGPKLSPSISPDGKQVAYILAEDAGYDVRKISVNGGDSEVLFCGHRPDGNVVPEGPQWSPDGTEIAAILYDFFQPQAWVVIIPEEGIPCGSLPDEMYPLDYGWLESSVSWSSDGSQFAFLEGHEDGHYLQIVDRSALSSMNSYRMVSPPDFPEGHGPVSLDWQRRLGSFQFALHTYSDEAKEETVWLLTVDEESNPPVAVAEEVAEGQSPTWSPDDSQLLFGGSPAWWGSGVLTRVTIATGGTEVLGSGYDPDWRRSAPECAEDDDCGIGDVCCGGACIAPKCQSAECEEFPPDVCTTDTCDPCAGCSHVFDVNNDPSCEPQTVACSDLMDKVLCNDEPTCRWHKRRGCNPR